MSDNTILPPRISAHSTSWRVKQGVLHFDRSVYLTREAAINAIALEAADGDQTAKDAIKILRGDKFYQLIQRVENDVRIFSGSIIRPDDIGAIEWLYCYGSDPLAVTVEGIDSIDFKEGWVDTLWSVSVPDSMKERIESIFLRNNFQAPPEENSFVIRGYSYEVDEEWNVLSFISSWKDGY